MIALLHVEARRLLSRRLFRVLTALALGGFLLAGLLSYINSKPDTLQEFRFVEMEEILLGLSFPFLVLAWLVGASAMGAEWPNRTMTSLLTWEPRRGRVLTAKYLTTVSLTALWIAVLCVVLSGILAVTAAGRGSLAGVDAAWLTDYARLIAKLAGAAAFAAALGLGLATIGRNTAAALGAGFAYLAIAESLVRAFRPSLSDWLLGDNLGLYLVGTTEMNLGHSQVAGGFVVLAYVAVVTLAASVFFKMREVG